MNFPNRDGVVDLAHHLDVYDFLQDPSSRINYLIGDRNVYLSL